MVAVTAAEWIAVLTPISILIALVLQQIDNRRKATEVSNVLEQRSEKTDEKLEVIRVDVNSNLTEALKRIDVLEGQLTALGHDPKGKEEEKP